MKRSSSFLLAIGLVIACCANVGCRATHRVAKKSATSIVSHAPDAEACGLVNGDHAVASKADFSAERDAQRNSKVVTVAYSRQLEPKNDSPDISINGDGALIGTAVESNVFIASGMTLESAEQLAIGNNPDLQKAQAAIASLQGKRVQVGLKPNPQVGYLSADVGEEGTAGQQGGFFSQEFIRGGKLELNRAIVCRQIKAAQQQYEIDKQRLLTDVRRRFYDLLVAQEKMETVRTFEQRTETIVDISDKLFAEEEISKIANLRSQLQLKNIQIVVEQAQNELEGARQRFAATTGMTSLGQLSSPSESQPILVSGQIQPNLSVADPNSSIEMIISGSPELAKAAEELEAAKWNLNRQIAEPTRNVQVQAGFTHGNVTGEDLVALQVGVPLRINDRNQGNIASARAEVTKAVQNIASIERDLSKRFSIAWRDYENARIQSEKFQSEILPAAAEFYELVELAYREGEQDYLDLVSAQQTYFDASLQSLDALREFWRSASLIDGYLLSEN